MMKKVKTTVLTESQEDYLEAILRLSAGKEGARVTDIASELTVKKSSVTEALRGLAARKLLRCDPYSLVKLTPLGAARAGKVSRNHGRIRDLLVSVLKISPARAETNACRMEHSLDQEVLDRLLACLAGKVTRRP